MLFIYFLGLQFMFLKYFRDIFISWGHNKPLNQHSAVLEVF